MYEDRNDRPDYLKVVRSDGIRVANLLKGIPYQELNAQERLSQARHVALALLLSTLAEERFLAGDNDEFVGIVHETLKASDYGLALLDSLSKTGSDPAHDFSHQSRQALDFAGRYEYREFFLYARALSHTLLARVGGRDVADVSRAFAEVPNSYLAENPPIHEEVVQWLCKEYRSELEALICSEN